MTIKLADGADIDLDDHPLLKARLEYEAAHPRNERLRRAEEMIVKGLIAFGFGKQYQVTREDSFEIAVDDLIISVRVDHEAKQDQERSE